MQEITLISYATSGELFWSADKTDGLGGPHHSISHQVAQRLIDQAISERDLEPSASLRDSRMNPSELIIKFEA